MLIGSKPIGVFAVCKDISEGRMGFINYAQIMIEFQNGLIATLDISWVTGSFIFSMEFHGTAGHIYLDVRNNDFFEVHGKSTPIDDIRRFHNRMKTIGKDILSGQFFAGAMIFYDFIYSNFFDAIRHDTRPDVDLMDGVIVNAILDAAFRSSQEKRYVELSKFIDI